MARARNIKPGFFRNEILGELPVEFRLLFVGLWTAADREGRLEYRPKRIKAEIFPYDDINVMDGLSMLQESGFIEIYIAEDKELIQIINWSKHQNPHHKEVASTLPAPVGHKDTVCSGYIPLSNTIRNRIYQRDGRKCRNCGAEHGLSIDHIIPVSKGGNSTDDNLQVLCIGCNIAKGNKIQEVTVAQVKHEPSMNHAQLNKIASSPLIPDSLIPSTLIPDSLIPDSGFPSVPAQQVAAEPKKKSSQQILQDLGVEEQHAKDWLTVRKAKRAPLTQTVLDDLAREAGKAGITVAEAVEICAKKSWQGFNASWNWSDVKPASGSKFQTACERRMAVTDAAIAEWLGDSNSPDVFEGEVSHV